MTARATIATLCVWTLCLLGQTAFALPQSSTSATDREVGRDISEGVEASRELPSPSPHPSMSRLLSQECPIGVGVPDPTCGEAYLAALNNNLSLAQTEPAASAARDWVAQDDREQTARRNAQSIEWLEAMGGAPIFDTYRIQAVNFYLSMGQPRRALRVLGPLLERQGSIDTVLAQRVRYAHLSALLETDQDEAAVAAAQSLMQTDGALDAGYLRYFASHILTHAAAQLEPWRQQLIDTGNTDMVNVLDWREGHTQPPQDPLKFPIVDCCTASRFVERNAAWLASARYQFLQGQAIPDLGRVMRAADALLMAWPRAGIDARQWWQLQDGAWYDLGQALPLPGGDDALWDYAEHGAPITPDQLKALQNMGWGSEPIPIVRQQIFLYLASHAQDPKRRWSALRRAKAGDGNRLFLYRLLAHDPAMLPGLAGDTSLTVDLLAEAAKQSRIPEENPQQHVVLGRQLSDSLHDPQAIPNASNTIKTRVLQHQQTRIQSLLILHEFDEAIRQASLTLRQIGAEPARDKRRAAVGLSIAIDALRSARQQPDAAPDGLDAYAREIRQWLERNRDLALTPQQQRALNDASN